MLRLYHRSFYPDNRVESRLIRFLLVIAAVLCCPLAHAQTADSSAKQFFQQERWPELVQLLRHAPRNSTGLHYYYRLALAHQERWEQPRTALRTGEGLWPPDQRFPIQLARIAFQQKKKPEAKHYLHRALRLDPADAYANDFAATIYFLEGNTEAALKYWNRIAKPEITALRTEPALHIRPVLLDHAFALAPASFLKLDQLLISQARMQMLEIFPSYRFDLSARENGQFDMIFHAQERNGFGNTKIEALLRTFGGIFFQEITPEYYNLRGSATNILSLVRWDPDKRRAYLWLSAPLGMDPKWRYRFGADLRDENWDVQTSFAGPSTLLGSLNMRREAVTAEISRRMGSRWRWSAGVELSHRDYRNVFPGVALTPQLLSQGWQIKQTA